MINLKKRYKVIRICSGIGKEKDIRYEKEKETESGSDGNRERKAKADQENMGIILQQGNCARRTSVSSYSVKKVEYKTYEVKNNHILKVEDILDSKVEMKRRIVKVIKKQNKDIG